jgi:hypothetical protein
MQCSPMVKNKYLTSLCVIQCIFIGISAVLGSRVVLHGVILTPLIWPKVLFLSAIAATAAIVFVGGKRNVRRDLLANWALAPLTLLCIIVWIIVLIALAGI